MKINFKTMSTKKKLIFSSSILSIINIPLIIIFFHRIITSMQILKDDTADPKKIDAVLSYSVFTPWFLISLFFFLILSAQLIIAAYLLNKGNKHEKIFGYLNLILGGIGINSVYAFIMYKKNWKTESKTSKHSKIINISSLFLTPIILAGTIIPFALYQGVDKETHIGPIEYSVNKDKPNIIEVFTDGFDPNQMLEYLSTGEEKTFLKDFNIFSRYVAPGASTVYSLPILLNGMQVNLFNANMGRKDNGTKPVLPNLTRDFLARSNVISNPTSDNNQNIFGIDYYKHTLLNTDGLSKSNDYQKQHSGDPDYVKEQYNILYPEHKDPFNVLTWSQAKHDTANRLGFTKYAPQTIYYQWAKTHGKVNNQINSKPQHLFLREGITHAPRVAKPDLTIQLSQDKETSLRNGVQALRTGINSFLQSLKQLKGKNGVSVYDNSMIIFYGDHANHSVKLSARNNSVGPKKYHSLAMIKYPNVGGQHNPAVINNRVFYGGFMNEVIAHWYQTNRTTSDISFINQNKNFNNNRVFWSFSYNDSIFTTFKDDSNILSISHNYGLKNSGFLSYSSYKNMTTNERKNLNTQMQWIGKTWWGGEHSEKILSI